MGQTYHQICFFIKKLFFVNQRNFSISILPIICILPFISGIFVEYTKNIREFIDTEAIVCAGQNVLAHVSPYAPAINCGRMIPARFVYPPITARIESIIQSHIGSTGIVVIYGFIYFTIFLAIMRAALQKDHLLYWRAPFLLCFSASDFLSGNISTIFHGLLFFVAISSVAWPLLLWFTIVIAGIIKPTFVVYSCVFLFQRNLHIMHRLLLSCSSILAIGLALGWTFYVDPTEFMQWLVRLHSVNTYSDFVQGHGFLASVEMFGIHNPKAEMMLYIPFAAAMLFAGLAIIRYAELSPESSIVLGISVCLLLYPRLLDYDEYTLPFGLAVIAMSFEKVKWPGRKWFRRIILGGCLTFALVGGLRGGIVLYWFSIFLLLALATQLILQTYRTRGGWPNLYSGINGKSA
ncbi:MAG: hypothetical protein POG74_06155 [Acidocella sp.]|nr:hypothetical protein [Acidocella sp.]